MPGFVVYYLNETFLLRCFWPRIRSVATHYYYFIIISWNSSGMKTRIQLQKDFQPIMRVPCIWLFLRVKDAIENVAEHVVLKSRCTTTSLQIRQSTTWYAGFLVRWNKWLADQASDVPRITFLEFLIDLGHSKLFVFIFVYVAIKYVKKINWKDFCKEFFQSSLLSLLRQS